MLYEVMDDGFTDALSAVFGQDAQTAEYIAIQVRADTTKSCDDTAFLSHRKLPMKEGSESLAGQV